MYAAHCSTTSVKLIGEVPGRQPGIIITQPVEIRIELIPWSLMWSRKADFAGGTHEELKIRHDVTACLSGVREWTEQFQHYCLLLYDHTVMRAVKQNCQSSANYHNLIIAYQYEIQRIRNTLDRRRNNLFHIPIMVRVSKLFNHSTVTDRLNRLSYSLNLSIT